MNQGTFAKCSFNKIKRTVYIQIGEIYIVNPMNPKMKKYRGEEVKLIKHDPFGDGASVLRLDSKWHVSRNYYTQIDICNLELKNMG